MASREKWSEEETILAFYYYCQIPFGRIHKENKEIIRIAGLIGRTPSAVVFKMGNLGHFDPELQKRNVAGLSNASKLDAAVVEKFINDWEGLSLQATIIERSFETGIPKEILLAQELPEGIDVITEASTRINQKFFREAVLSSYGNRCCITGISEAPLLEASHIKPWKVADKKTERTNPCNGLCLNVLHHRAFDKGIITVLPDLTIRVSSKLIGDDNGTLWLRQCDKKSIEKPRRFFPGKEFLEYHNDVVFIP